MPQWADGLLRGKRWERGVCLLLVLGWMVQPLSSAGQEINLDGWPIPDLKALLPYSMSIQNVDGVEKMTEVFFTPSGGHVARISGNGKVYAYAVDRNQEPPIDYLILDPDGSGRFTMKYGPDAVYLIPEWVSR
jgi:hypothetical protein